MKRYDLVDRGMWERDMRMEECGDGEWVSYDDVADALRQRKWPEEKPDLGKFCLVKSNGTPMIAKMMPSKMNPGEFFFLSQERGEVLYTDSVTHWLPVPPMGEE